MIKKVIFPLFLLLSVTLLYTLLFPTKLYNTNIFLISQIIDTTSNLAQSQEDTEVDGYYISENECGFFKFNFDNNGNGKIINKIMLDENKRLEANKYFYATYEKVGNNISLFLPNGVKIKDIETPCYPYIIDDIQKVYFIKTNGTGFIVYNIEGEKMFSDVDYSSFITSISGDYIGYTLVSNMDGISYLYTNEGEVIFENRIDSDHSKYVYTKGNTIDKDGKYMAIWSGIEPEYIEIFQKRTGNKVAKIETNTNLRYKPIMEFKKNRLYYEGKNKFEYYDIINKKNGKGLDYTGELKEINFSNDGSILVLSRDDKASYLSLYSESGLKYFYKEFSKIEIDNVRFVDKKSFYFRMDNRIIKMSAKESA